MELNKKKRYIIIIIITIIAILSLSTYAWLSYRTNDTAMVLTVGDINNVRITMSPYQIDAKISPNLTYTGQKYTTVEVVNNSSSPRNIKLFYKINAIDSELATSNLKYTIEKKEVGSSSYTHITPDGNFNGASKGDIITILEESAPVGTTYYKVYVWLYSASSAQNNVPGKKINAELNAEIGENQYQVTFDADGGTVSPETMVVEYGSTYQNLPTPSRTGYTFLGWNGKNMLNLSTCTFTYCTLNANNSITSNINNSYYSSIYANYLASYFMENLGKTFTYSMSEPISNRSFGIVIYGPRSGGSTYQEINGGATNKTTFTVATDFTNITKVELRFNRLGSTFTDTTTTRTNFQIEIGSNATAYEPYYITNGTTVVQNQNHTLTAIWQKNS